MNRPELTPHERALIAGRVDYRGYTPDDEVPEPSEAPSEPAGVSKAAAEHEPGPEAS
jgi:hypothetical protein